MNIFLEKYEKFQFMFFLYFLIDTFYHLQHHFQHFLFKGYFMTWLIFLLIMNILFLF